MRNGPIIKPLQRASELEELKEAARADDHRVLAATHLVLKDGKIVGYGSLGGIPLVNVWLDSQRVSARESLALLSSTENILRHCGQRALLMPCSDSSPFKPYMQALGYQELGRTVMHLKEL